MKNKPASCRAGFTLVELLVVIGIIALLISILLPSLNSARKQANTVKCLSNLRQIGNAMNFYANDNKGVFPVSVWRNAQANWQMNYVYEGETNSAALTPRNWYWHMFIQKYLNSKIARNVASAQDRDWIGKNNVLWGCPEWRPWVDTGFTGGINIDEVGYGMNWSPTYRADFPSATNPDVPGIAGIDAVNTTIAPSWDHRSYRQMHTPALNNKPGRFFKVVEWKEPSERGLVCDSEYFAPALDTGPDADGFPPPQMTHIYQKFGAYNLDFFRHGRVPPKTSLTGTPPAPAFDMRSGGKPSINMLYVDGHAATLNTYGDVYMALRRKYK